MKRLVLQSSPKPQWSWTIYTTSQGRVPKDLGEIFGDLVPRLREAYADLVPPDLPSLVAYKDKGILDEVEMETLARTLKKYVEYGLGPDSRLVGTIEKLRGKPYKDLSEFRVANTKHNPRLIYARLSGPKIVFLSAFTKKNNGPIQQEEKDRALSRWKDFGGHQ